jgi:predicted nucleic acid-binding protein
VIVLDASVVIAHLASHDAHHPAARTFFEHHLDDDFVVHTMTLTEILIGPIRVGRASFAEQQLADLGVVEWAPTDGAARLARLRVETKLRLPDCCVLDTALSNGASLATFDSELARAAVSLGLELAEVG